MTAVIKAFFLAYGNGTFANFLIVADRLWISSILRRRW